MAGVNSLGLGSGTLNSALIEQLKAADQKILINPIDDAMSKIKTKQGDLSTLMIALSSAKSGAVDLSSDSTFLKRTTTTTATNNEVSIAANDGVTAQSFSMTVSQLAQNDIMQSIGFASTSASVASTSTTLTIKSGSSNAVSVSISAGTTLEQLVQKINDASGGTVTATTLNTGVGTTPYRLILKGVNTGVDNTLTVSEGSGLSLGLSTPSITGAAATTSAIGGSAGDLKINGVSIDAVTTMSTNTAEQNAQLFVTSINAKYADTGVLATTDGAGSIKLSSDGRGMVVQSTANGATASGLFSTTGGAAYTGVATASAASSEREHRSSSSDLVGAAGDVTINGVAIDAVTTLAANSAEQNAQLFVTAINAKTSQTGVTAITDGAGKLSLYSDGRSIDLVTTANGATASGLTSEAQTVPTISGFTKLQYAKDAVFTLDGIDMSRSSNTVTDIVTGVTFSLNKTTTSSVSLAIKQDTSGIPKMVSDFVQAYNALSSKLGELTAYDVTKRTAGTLQGVSEVSGISSKLANIITTRDSSGNSLMDYGFALDKTGSLSVDNTVLNAKLSADPTAFENLFKGKTTITAASYSALRTASAADTVGILGDITINGINIEAVDTLSTNTAEQNAQLFVAAISAKSDETGVTASTDGAGKIVLTNRSGGRINLATTANGALASGLSADSTSSMAISSTLVAVGKTTSTNGIFKQLNTEFGLLISGKNSRLEQYSQSLTTEMDTKTKAKETANERIAQKYKIMSAQFAAYDAMIGKYQSMFASLKQQIDQASKSGG